METKPAAGPWTSEFGETSGYDCMTGAYIISDKNKNTIAVIDQGDFGQKNCDYNYRSSDAAHVAFLISTAPELLAVAIAIRDIVDYSGIVTVREMAYKAILKAEVR